MDGARERHHAIVIMAMAGKREGTDKLIQVMGETMRNPKVESKHLLRIIYWPLKTDLYEQEGRASV